LINKTLAQMNAERAAKRAGHNLKLKAAAMPPESSHKLQASSALKRTQLNNRVKK
jgi:hypothetical protein